MKRPFAIIVFLCLLAGCTSRKPLAPDPFFGRTAIPPPVTGAARTSRDPGYPAASLQPTAVSASVASVSPAPADSWTSKDNRASLTTSNAAQSASYTTAAAAPSAGSSTDRAWPGGSIGSSGPSAIKTRVPPPDYRHHAVAASDAAASGNSSVASPPSTASASSSTAEGGGSVRSGENQVVCTLQPLATSAGGQTQQAGPAEQPFRPGSTSTASAVTPSWTSRSSAGVSDQAAASMASAPLRAPRQIAPPTRVTDIMELPDRGARAAGRGRVDTNVRPTSATMVSGGGRPTVVRAQSTVRTGNSPVGSGVARSTPISPPLRYGHDPAYGWLRGKLEYSEIAKRWRLRYIPINSKADQFGGSVVLGESTLLTGQRDGDFIEVRGRLLAGENGDWGYAAVYQVAQLRPIGK